MIESYINRGVLIAESDSYRWKPRIFEGWLRGTGYKRITTGFLDETAITASEREEQEAYVEPGRNIGIGFAVWIVQRFRDN